LASHIGDIALGDGLFGRCRGNNAIFFGQLGGIGNRFIGQAGGCPVLLQKNLDLGFILFQEGLAAHKDTCDHQAAIVQVLPGGIEVNRHLQARHLALGHCHIGLGQQGHHARHLGQQGDHLSGFGFPFQGDVLVRVNAMLLQQIAQGILRAGAFARRIKGLAAQIGKGLDGRTCFHQVADTECIDGQDLHLSFGIVVENRSQIGRNGSQVHLAIDQLRCDLVRRAMDRERIAVLSFALLILIHQMDQSDPGWPFEAGNPDLPGWGQGCIRRTAPAKKEQAKSQDDGT